MLRAARDKGRLSAARPDPGGCFPDAGSTLIHADSAPPPPASPPRGVGSGGVRGGGESTFPLKPRRNVGGFPEIRPRPPAGRPPLTWTSSPGNTRRGDRAHLGGRGQVLFRFPPEASRSGKGGAGTNKFYFQLWGAPDCDLTLHASVSPFTRSTGCSFVRLSTPPNSTQGLV